MNSGVTQSAQGIGAALPALDEEQVWWSSAAARHLQGAGYNVAIRSNDLAPHRWFLGEHIAFRPCGDPPPAGAAAETLMEVIEAHGDLLSEIEQLIGLAAEFGDFGDLPRGLAVLEVSRSDEAVCQLAILSDVKPIAPARAPISVTLRFVAARLSIGEAEALQSGDMIVLERGPWPLSHCPPQLSVAPLSLAPESGQLVPILGGTNHSLDGRTLDPIAMPKTLDTHDLKVPVSINFGQTLVTQSELAEMLERGAFDLGAISEGMHAVLTVGGRTIGEGEIVRLGDRFAVLLSESGEAEPGDAEADRTAEAAQPDLPEDKAADHPEFTGRVTMPENE